jgi:hypothetical protein
MLVHARVIDLFEEQDAVVPDQWCHDLAEGSLTYRFGSSTNTFTWQADAVEAMADEIDGEPASERARELLSLWSGVRRILDEGELADPDRVYVDDLADEMMLVWHEPKLVVVIGPD